jgi:hypothetical protein
MVPCCWDRLCLSRSLLIAEIRCLVGLIWSHGGGERLAGQVGVIVSKTLLAKFKQQRGLEEMAPRLVLPGVH